MVRFEHLFDVHEHDELSAPIDFELPSDFFNGFQITDVKEMYLGGNKAKPLFNSEVFEAKGSVTIHLEPMDIKTYVLSVSY